MATTNTFAYNTGSAITGTTQIGSLAIGFPTSGYDTTGLQWWTGPDEDLGYVIAYPVSSGLHPAIGGTSTSYIGFKRTKTKTDSAFISLANKVANGATGDFATAADAKTWLNANGYWTSYTSVSAVTFSQLFTSGQAPGTTIENAWTTFRAQLTGSYTNFTFTSSLSGSTSYNVSDATKVQTLATNLKNGTAVSVTIGGTVWLIGCCTCRAGGGNANTVEFCNISPCSVSSTASLRPHINNANWGGIGATTNAATQTLTLSFS